MFGKIKHFKQEKKYGFICSPDQEEDFFFHLSKVIGDDVKCVKDEEVEFDVIESKRKPGTFEALNIKHRAGYTEKKFSLEGHPSSYLFQWAYIQLDDIETEGGDFKKSVLHELKNLALDEDWTYGDSKNMRIPFPILRNYLINTFYKLYKDGCVREVTYRGESWAAFNTGLVDELYDPIYALFEKNIQPRQPWQFNSFCSANIGSKGQVLAINFNPLPATAKYFTNAKEVIFDPDTPITPRYDHIVYDSIERGRYPNEFLRLHVPGGFVWKDPSKLSNFERKTYLYEFRKAIENSPQTGRDIRSRIDDAIELAVKRARWNFKTAIPLFYPRGNNISLLLPIALVNDEEVDLALVVSRTAAGAYSGETVYKLKWAYDHARLVCRPDSDWLTPYDDEYEEEEDQDEEEIAIPDKEILPIDRPVQCPVCGRVYSVPIEKLRNLPKKVRCNDCDEVFVIYAE